MRTPISGAIHYQMFLADSTLISYRIIMYKTSYIFRSEPHPSRGTFLFWESSANHPVPAGLGYERWIGPPGVYVFGEDRPITQGTNCQFRETSTSPQEPRHACWPARAHTLSPPPREWRALSLRRWRIRKKNSGPW